MTKQSPSTWLQTLVLAVGLALLAAVPALVFAEAPKVDLARFDYGLRARALADGVYVSKVPMTTSRSPTAATSSTPASSRPATASWSSTPAPAGATASSCGR